MARPHKATRRATTSLGTPFQWDLESMRSTGARDAASEQILVLVGEADREAFLREAVGYTTANKTNLLQRVLPLRHPKRPQFWCDTYELVDYGAYESRSDFGDPANNEAPAQDWYRYQLTFVRPKWRLWTNAELADPALFGLDVNKEQYRYAWVSRMPRPRERRVSGLAYQYLPVGGNPANDADWKTIPDESQFVPDWQKDLVVTWLQVPVGAVPEDAIDDCLNCVNAQAIGFGTTGRSWAPETLLFKGLAKPIEEYVGADGSLYVDLAYLFTQQPGTWNRYLTRDAAGNKIYQPIRIRVGPAPGLAGAGFPPYFRREFQALFVPA